MIGGPMPFTPPSSAVLSPCVPPSRYRPRRVSSCCGVQRDTTQITTRPTLRVPREVVHNGSRDPHDLVFRSHVWLRPGDHQRRPRDRPDRYGVCRAVRRWSADRVGDLARRPLTAEPTRASGAWVRFTACRCGPPVSASWRTRPAARVVNCRRITVKPCGRRPEVTSRYASPPGERGGADSAGDGLAPGRIGSEGLVQSPALPLSVEAGSQALRLLDPLNC